MFSSLKPPARKNGLSKEESKDQSKVSPVPPAPLSRRTKSAGLFSASVRSSGGPDGKGTDQRNCNLFFQFFQIALGLLSVELDGFQCAVSYQRKNGLHGGVYEDANGKNLRGEESGKLPDFFPGNISPALWHVDDETGEIRFCFVDVSDILRPSEAADFNLWS